MHPKFKEAIDSLHNSFERLLAMQPVKVAAMPKGMPTQGVYLFSKDGKHLYVGRSNKLHKRPDRHCSETATHRMAAFAFKLARERTGLKKASYKKGPESRAGLMENPVFKAAFDEAKAEIRTMDLRFVEECDQVRQMLLEVYCAVALEAPYNDFKTT